MTRTPGRRFGVGGAIPWRQPGRRAMWTRRRALRLSVWLHRRTQCGCHEVCGQLPSARARRTPADHEPVDDSIRCLSPVIRPVLVQRTLAPTCGPDPAACRNGSPVPLTPHRWRRKLGLSIVLPDRAASLCCFCAVQARAFNPDFRGSDCEISATSVPAGRRWQRRFRLRMCHDRVRIAVAVRWTNAR